MREQSGRASAASLLLLSQCQKYVLPLLAFLLCRSLFLFAFSIVTTQDLRTPLDMAAYGDLLMRLLTEWGAPLEAEDEVPRGPIFMTFRDFAIHPDCALL